ncbi:lysozyme inhibitor LprI family protein [Acinetobacter sp.]|uniref:lysozyme inhibitor LprI family protein n=1 Tax=Acinetobacter sp. TaxID=472 RepID=UPI00388F505F
MPNIITKALCISPLLLISSLSFADCDRNMNQTDLNMCTAQEYKKADQKLNKLYQAYTAKLSRAERKQFTAIQKSWVNYKDKDCQYAAQNYKDGSIYPLLINSCLTEKTEDRIDDLEDYLQEANR